MAPSASPPDEPRGAASRAGRGGRARERREGKPARRFGMTPMTGQKGDHILHRRRGPRSRIGRARQSRKPIGRRTGVRRLKVAVDIGGTFTDLVAHDAQSGELLTVKTPSTPPSFIDGVINALEKAGITPDEVAIFKHGSTIATNAIIERRGAKTGLVTTKGFRDVLGAGRANRPDLFNSNWDPSPPLVPRRHVLEVRERVDYEGNVIEELDEDDVRAAARKFKRREIESVAVAYINSFMRPEHERRTKEILLEELGDGAFVCTSSDILPEIREFERTSTVAANAYLMPVIDSYIDKLGAALREWGYEGELYVTHSGGGVVTARAARGVPARICHSGPAGGVIGGLLVGGLSGFDNVITFDMGGTSADLALVHDREPTLSPEWRVDWNIPILFPAIDLVAIGAGGGTIAWVDAGGSLRAGPQSAGADPGPACFDKGNLDPTITDAHLYLGRLNPESYLGGDLEIRPELAEAAIARLAEKLDLSVAKTASGVLRIANANMTSATHLISVERGHDPRDFALVAGGGAGPLHAVEIARELRIPQVVVPPTPGVTSALGILHVDLRHDLLAPVLQQIKHLDIEALRRTFDRLTAEATGILAAESIPDERRSIELSVDARYYGQTPYMNLRLDRVPTNAAEVDSLVADYRSRYENEFGYQLPEDVATVEIVNARVAAIGVTDDVELPTSERSGDTEAARKGARAVYFDETAEFTDTPIYDRSRLAAGARIDGPAVIEQTDTTVLVPPGARASVDRYLNVVIEVSAGGDPAPAGVAVGAAKGE
ncbi:MAG: hydantoinase/oxoprolinase family protein [Solirubrobacterales bacterium]|nr:hydantoinase/oxoprolinase family protein [Solirubrobacterales bacterium]